MNRPAAVEIAYECMRFLITHNPTNATLNKFTEVRPHLSVCISVPLCLCVSSPFSKSSLSLHICQDLKKFEVNTLVRVCDSTYDKAPVEKEGIQVLVRVDSKVHFWQPFLLLVSHVRLNLASYVSSRTGPSMMAPLLPLRLWTTGSSCSTPSSERSLAAASLCTAWQGLAGE